MNIYQVSQSDKNLYYNLIGLIKKQVVGYEALLATSKEEHVVIFNPSLRHPLVLQYNGNVVELQGNSEVTNALLALQAEASSKNKIKLNQMRIYLNNWVLKAHEVDWCCMSICEIGGIYRLTCPFDKKFRKFKNSKWSEYNEELSDELAESCKDLVRYLTVYNCQYFMEYVRLYNQGDKLYIGALRDEHYDSPTSRLQEYKDLSENQQIAICDIIALTHDDISDIYIVVDNSASCKRGLYKAKSLVTDGEYSLLIRVPGFI